MLCFFVLVKMILNYRLMSCALLTGSNSSNIPLRSQNTFWGLCVFSKKYHEPIWVHEPGLLNEAFPSLLLKIYTNGH